MDALRGQRDIVSWADLPMALGLLTRLPVPVDHARATARGARGAWAWPLAGVVTGGLAAGVALAALALDLPAALAAGLALAAQVIVTGAMHEDGLADSADGLWGGWTPERRLEIMKDSRTGAYGVIALVLSFGLRWQALALLVPMGWGLVAVAVLSRAGMVALAGALPHARSGGLSAAVGRPGARTVALALAVGLTVAAACTGWAVLALALVMAVVLGLWALLARAKIGGQTGDVLGAGQQLAEIAGLLVLVSAV